MAEKKIMFVFHGKGINAKIGKGSLAGVGNDFEAWHKE